MDIVAVGYPSQLTTWGFATLESLLRSIAPDLAVVHLDRFDRLEDLGSFEGTRLVLSSFPNADFADDCRRLRVPTLCFVDDPTEAVCHLRASYDQMPAEALRAISAGLVLSLPFMRHRHSLVLRRSKKVKHAAVLKQISSHLGIAPTTIHTLVDSSTLAEARAVDGLSLDAHLRRSFASTVSPEERAAAHELTEQVLGGLLNYGLGEPPTSVTWPRDCFLSGDRPDTFVPLVSDVIGRARIIYYGPYYHLPAGRWNANVVIGFSADIRGMPFTIEVASTTILGRARIMAERGGIFAAEFEICVTCPHEAIEVRIMNDQGAIEGRVGLVRVVFSDWRPSEDGST